MMGIIKGIEIVTISDIPTLGSGLGSSSALAVGLLNALYAFKGHKAQPETLAQKACELEIEILKSPIGKQDQWASALGGFNHFIFNPDGSVSREDLLLSSNYNKIKWLENNSLLFYLGFTRSANGILKEHKNNIANQNKKYYLDLMKLLVNDFKFWLQDDKVSHTPGALINTGWTYKKQMAKGYTNKEIDSLIQKTLDAGACGIKLCGGGGGGFMLVICEKDNQHNLRIALKDLHELKFDFEEEGSRIIYNQ